MINRNISGSAYLHSIPTDIKRQIQQAIKNIEDWQRRRAELDVCLLLMEQEKGVHLRLLNDLRGLLHDCHAWQDSMSKDAKQQGVTIGCNLKTC